MKRYLYLLFLVVMLFSLLSCVENRIFPNHDSGVRNVRFDPGLLNRSRLADGTPATAYTFTKDSKKVYLGNVYPGQVLVIFQAGITPDEQQELFTRLGFIKALGLPVSAGSVVFHWLELVEGLNSLQAEQAISELQNRPEIIYAAPSFLAGNQLLGVSNELKLQFSGTEQDLEQLLRAAYATLASKLADNTYLVRMDNKAGGNALVLANSLNGQEGITQAEPLFLHLAL